MALGRVLMGIIPELRRNRYGEWELPEGIMVLGRIPRFRLVVSSLSNCTPRSPDCSFTQPAFHAALLASILYAVWTWSYYRTIMT
jgi:hypothetical protein